MYAVDCLIGLGAYGALDDASGKKEYISINNVVIQSVDGNRPYPNGFNTVELDVDTCKTANLQNFDTSYSSNGGANALASYISQLSTSTVLLGATGYDATTNMNSAARTALFNIGVNVTPLETCGKVVFVAYVGRPSATEVNIAPSSGQNLRLNTTVQRECIIRLSKFL